MKNSIGYARSISKNNFENNNKLALKHVMWFLLMSGISLSIAVFIITDTTKPYYYSILWLLPVMFVFSSIIMNNALKLTTDSPALLIIFVTYFIRYVLSPFILLLGNYETFIPGNRVAYEMTEAIFLMCYEIIAVSFLISIYTRNNISALKKPTYLLFRSNNFETIKLSKKFKLAIFLIILFMVYVIITTPNIIRANFTTLLGSSEDWKVSLEYSSIHDSNSYGVSGLKVSLFISLFSLIQALLPPTFMILIYNSKKSMKIQRFNIFVIALVVMIVSTETRAYSIECAFAFLFTATTLYGKKLKRYIYIFSTCAAVTIFVGIMLKLGMEVSGSNVFSDLSVATTSYFSSASGVAITILAKQNISKMNILNIGNDFLSRIPYLSSYLRPFYGINTGRLLNYFIAGSTTKSYGFIMPSIGIGYVYFGALFAPIIPCLAAWLALRFDVKAQHEKKSILKKNVYILGAIMLARCTGTANMFSGFTALITIAFILFLLKSFEKRTQLVERMR